MECSPSPPKQPPRNPNSFFFPILSFQPNFSPFLPLRFLLLSFLTTGLLTHSLTAHLSHGNSEEKPTLTAAEKELTAAQWIERGNSSMQEARNTLSHDFSKAGQAFQNALALAPEDPEATLGMAWVANSNPRLQKRQGMEPQGARPPA